ncbi:unnamed protein product [Schistosoma turkestanicum]|nr:unnamed protein product [Schistosoma turkestanicum]
MCSNVELKKPVFGRECVTLSSCENVSHDDDTYYVGDVSTNSINKCNLDENSSDLQSVNQILPRYCDTNYYSSRPGAFFPWPQNVAGKIIGKRSGRNSAPSALLGIEIEHRPPTNIPGSIKMAFGRAAPGYYAHKSSNKKTWFDSDVLHHHVPILKFDPSPRNLDDYKKYYDNYKECLHNVNKLTEYQDKYLIHTPSLKKPTR